MRTYLATALVLTIGAALAYQGQDAANARRARLSAEEDLLFLPRPSAIHALSLGHHELAADLVYLRAVLYFGTQVSMKGELRWLDNYLQTIIDLDPRWKTPYRWAGVATMYNGQAITRERILASNHFLKLGIEHFPSDWELPFMLGCNLLFELKAKDATEHARFTSEGADWIRRAALVGGAPPWAALLAATILRKEGREDAALRHLEQVYYSTTDERTRQEVHNRLLALKTSIDFEREARDRARFSAEKKATLPYVSDTLFALVGPRPAPNLDWRSLGSIPARLAADATRATAR